MRSPLRAVLVAVTVPALLAAAAAASAQEPPSRIQICAATDIAAVDDLLSQISTEDLVTRLQPLASLTVPGDPDGVVLRESVDLTDVRQALNCDDPATPTPTATPEPTTTVPPVPSTPPLYADCDDAAAAGAAPILSGQPGYRPELDSDRDGVACEAPSEVQTPTDRPDDTVDALPQGGIETGGL